MGNYYCKKCGIQRNYYPNNYTRNSCRYPGSLEEEILYGHGNYPHRWSNVFHIKKEEIFKCFEKQNNKYLKT